MRNLIFGIFIGFMVAAPLAHTQPEPEKIVVGAPLEIGMAKDKVFSLIEQNGFSLIPFANDPTRWLVAKMNSEKDYETAGMVGFTGSRLTWALRNWADSDDKGATKIARGFYFLMKGFEEKGDTKCSLSTTTSDSPDYESKQIRILCGRRLSVIDVSKYKDRNLQVTVHEEVRGSQ